MRKWDVEVDKAVVDVAAVADEGKDKDLDGWAGQRLDRAASVSARRAGIENRTFPDSHAPKNSARNVARG